MGAEESDREREDMGGLVQGDVEWGWPKDSLLGANRIKSPCPFITLFKKGYCNVFKVIYIIYIYI
jgi:hypothetical protein